MSWGERTVEYDDLFKAMNEWLTKKAHGDTQVYFTGHGSTRVSSIRNWIQILSVLGSKLMNCANGLAMINGRPSPTWDDFRQAGFLIDSGRLMDIMDQPDDSPFAIGCVKEPVNEELDV